VAAVTFIFHNPTVREAEISTNAGKHQELPITQRHINTTQKCASSGKLPRELKTAQMAATSVAI